MTVQYSIATARSVSGHLDQMASASFYGAIKIDKPPPPPRVI